MKAEPKKIELDFNEKKVTVHCHQLRTSQSLIFLMFAGKIIGGSAGKFIGAMDGKSLTELVDKTDLDMDKLGNAISGFFERLEDKDFIEKLNLLLSSVKHEGESLDVDHAFFDGNLPQLFRVCKVALEVNYKGFLPASSGLLKRLKDLTQSQKNTQGVQA